MGVDAHAQRAGKFEFSFFPFSFCLEMFTILFVVSSFKGIIKKEKRAKRYKKKVQRFLSMPSVGGGKKTIKRRWSIRLVCRNRELLFKSSSPCLVTLINLEPVVILWMNDVSPVRRCDCVKLRPPIRATCKFGCSWRPTHLPHTIRFDAWHCKVGTCTR